MNGPAMVVTYYGPVEAWNDRDGWTSHECCNVQRPTDGSACAFKKDHDGMHSWQHDPSDFFVESAS